MNEKATQLRGKLLVAFFPDGFDVNTSFTEVEIISLVHSACAPLTAFYIPDDVQTESHEA
jgi:hypothetical protein